jgi:hypothetical protein
VLTGYAAGSVRALVSGLPCGEYERRLFMVLQAYIDDSGNSPDSYAFVLAGFVASSEAWTKFCDDWQTVLDRPPGAAYLKAAQAFSLNDEFHKKKWTHKLRDTVVHDLIAVINDHVHEKVAVWVKREHFNKHLKTLALPYGRDAADHPYLLSFYWMIISVAMLHSVRQPEPCDFTFDEQSLIGENALGWWGMFKRNASATPSGINYTPFLGAPPTFRDEKQFRPLQAADLYAWLINRWVRQNKLVYMPRSKELVMLDQPAMQTIELELTERQLIDLRDTLVEIGRKFAEANPDVPLKTVAPKKRPRAKWFPSGI